MISEKAKEIFSDYFSKSENYMTNTDLSLKNIYSRLSENEYMFIKSSFSKVESEIEEMKIDVGHSGSTANLIILIDKKLICVNCGDSRAILNTKKDDKVKANIPFKTSNDHLDWEAIALSQDHKPDLEEEMRRIINCNGRVERYQTDEGPFRVWLKEEDSPGLAMSRSLGDKVAKTVGVIFNPGLIILIEDIFEYEINDNSQFAVVASDGIWEFLSNEEVCRIILPFYQKNDIKGAIEKLFYEAIRLWKEVYLLLSS